MEWHKNALRSVANRFGLDVRRHTKSSQLSSSDHRRFRQLCNSGTTLIFDVGANIGQYVQSVRLAGYDGRVVSFEPVSAAYCKLTSIAKNDPNWQCEKVAIGAVNETVMINVSANNAESSSFLNMREEHVQAAPFAAYTSQEAVRKVRLDELVNDLSLVQPGDRIWLKADVQGYELEVLEGAGQLFDGLHIVGVEAELSLVPLYEGGPSIEDVVSWLRRRNFVLVAVEEVFRDGRDDATLQLAGIFIKEKI